MKPLKHIILDEHDLLEGLGRDILTAAFQCKNINIEIENNFARIAKMKAAGHGKSDKSSHLFSKHLLAELKALHRSCLSHANQSDFLLTQGVPNPIVNEHETLSGNASHSSLSELICFDYGFVLLVLTV